MISDKLSDGLYRPAERGSSELIGQQPSIRPTNQGLLSRLPEHLLRSLFSRATTVRLKTDEVLFLTGDPSDGCYRVLDGLLKVVMTSNGNERILALLGLCPNVKSGIKRHTGRGNRVMLVQIEENSATLTPFGSVIRINPASRVSNGKSWMAKLRAVLALLFR